jgi:CelD/BcsL family acetyltransferase involved in cellulose biosynthesis
MNAVDEGAIRNRQLEQTAHDGASVDILQGLKKDRIEFRFSISLVKIFGISFAGRSRDLSFMSSLNGEYSSLHQDMLTDRIFNEIAQDDEVLAIRNLRIESPLPRMRFTRRGLVYACEQELNYFIELRGSFEDYISRLSQNTRSTLLRKVKGFRTISDGNIDFRTYRTPSEMTEFHRLARSIAEKTYQEKMFQGALPESAQFRQEMNALASRDQVRGFLLFLQGNPVAYLCIPISDGVADYSYLGYDPGFAKSSPGNVLLFHAIQSLFGEKGLNYFNFEYGGSQTKIVFSTGHFLRADVYCFKHSLKSLTVICGHLGMERFSKSCGRMAEKMGLRRSIRRWLRHGRLRAP